MLFDVSELYSGIIFLLPEIYPLNIPLDIRVSWEINSVSVGLNITIFPHYEMITCLYIYFLVQSYFSFSTFHGSNSYLLMHNKLPQA